MAEHETPKRIRDDGARHDRALQRAIDKERHKLKTLPADHPYREEMDSISEVTVGKEGIKVKARSPWVTVVLAFFGLVAFLGWLWLHR